MIRSHSRKTDILARYGGDEFTLALPNTNLEDATLIAEKLRGKIAELSAVAGPEPGSASIHSWVASPLMADRKPSVSAPHSEAAAND